jgi:DNA-binding NtrC family response regulator/tetratricopeptide (TPR) repeat protein
MRRGRFSDVVSALQPFARTPRDLHFSALAESVLADALQRIGENQRAESMSFRTLQKEVLTPESKARYHFVLGNIHRDRGDNTKAVEQFQKALAVGSCDAELSCWAKLRLLIAIGHVTGAHTALARLDEVKRAFTRLGDGRLFAALHLWLAEVDTIDGDLDRAHHHLKTADSLLSQVDDVCLRGAHAVNSSAFYYYCAEIAEARRWAELAISYARQSGARRTVRAAHGNLGYIEFSLGDFIRAENCFRTALECCEEGTLDEIITLDNIAEIRLHNGDLEGCKSILHKLDQLTDQHRDVKRQYYKAWALQTKIRLLLRQGKNAEAKSLCDTVRELLAQAPNARVTTESHLLQSQIFVANDELRAAAEELSPLFFLERPLAPDLFAEMERIAGKTLAKMGSSTLSRVRLDRSFRTYETIGHSVGTKQSLCDLGPVPAFNGFKDATICSQVVLDRIRALLDMRGRPDLFGRESAILLEELDCAQAISLYLEDGKNKTSTRSANDSNTDNTSTKMVTIGSTAQGRVILSYVPREDATSKLNCLDFERVVKGILSTSTRKIESVQQVVWTTETLSPNQTVLFASESMQSIMRVGRQIARTDVSVLVTGETGTGKEVIARTIHEWSSRSVMPFVALNCTAIPKDLLESQLFGHRKGAFSGANDNFQGVVRAANGGTLLLDEIGDMPLDMQAKLLRFLEMGEVHPIGETQPIKVNVRLIFATNGDLEEAVNQNRFRQDLFYRINVVPIRIPPLRERKEEIPVLTNLFAQRFAKEFAKEALQFSAGAMELLILYSWPGNVRQLANEVRRLTALVEPGACITPEHLSPYLRPKSGGVPLTTQAVPELAVRIDQPLDKAVERLEAEMIQRALRQANGHVSSAASALGISRKGLYLKRMRLGLMSATHNAHPES